MVILARHSPGRAFHDPFEAAPRPNPVAQWIGPAIDNTVADIVISPMVNCMIPRSNEEIIVLHYSNDLPPSIFVPKAVCIGPEDHDARDHEADRHRGKNCWCRIGGESKRQRD